MTTRISTVTSLGRPIRPDQNPSDLALDDLDARISGLFPTVSPLVYLDASISECARIISRGGRGLVLVLEKGTDVPKGVVDITSVMDALAGTSEENTADTGAGEKAVERVKKGDVRDIMRPCDDLIARPRNPSEALRMMEARNLPLLVMVNADGSFQGMVGRTDLLESETRRLREYSTRMQSTLKSLQSEIRAVQDEHDEMTSMLAHDLRGPLGGIQGISAVLASDQKNLSPEQVHDFSNLIKGQVLQLIKLTKDVLDLSRCRAGKLPLKFGKCDPKFLVLETCTLYRKLAERKEIAFEVNLPSDPVPDIMADRDRLQTVLSNLLDNAVKYCKKGEKVSISIEQSPSDFTFVVADNGQGLPKEEFERLFERFGRGSSMTTAGEPSSGLGLAIAKEIVKAHGGKISVSGDKGVGLTFRVTLPVHGNLPEFLQQK